MRTLIIFTFLLVSLPAFSYSEREENIFRSIKCLACEGQSVLGSEAEFAKSMRESIRQHIQQGKSDEQIYSLLRKHYGDEIFFEPPFVISTYLLWFLPVLFLILGIILVILVQSKYKPNKQQNG